MADRWRGEDDIQRWRTSARGMSAMSSSRAAEVGTGSATSAGVSQHWTGVPRATSTRRRTVLDQFRQVGWLFCSRDGWLRSGRRTVCTILDEWRQLVVVILSDCNRRRRSLR
jgi:hypothetical protein